MARKTRFKGIREKNDTSFEASVRVNGKLFSKVLPKTYPDVIKELQRWMETTKADNADPNAPSKAGTFGADIEAYINRRSSIASIGKIAGCLRYFVRIFGADRHRHTITQKDVNAALNDLNKTLEPGTVIGYRTALRAFFYEIDPARTNPVADSFHPGTPKAEPRGRDMELIAKAIDAMADTRHATGKPSLSKIRVAVIAYTGLPPASLKKITASDLRPSPLAPTTVRVPRRKKGGGVEPRIVPLTTQGAAAFVAFHQANAYGPFNTATVGRSFKNGCKRVDIDPKSIRLYDLRHSFLTHVFRVTRDTATVARFAMHADGSPLTARYTYVAHEDVDATAAANVSASLMSAPFAPAPRVQSKRRPVQKLAGKVGRRHKLALVKHLQVPA